jgi:hypothetical protein
MLSYGITLSSFKMGRDVVVHNITHRERLQIHCHGLFSFLPFGRPVPLARALSACSICSVGHIRVSLFLSFLSLLFCHSIRDASV